MALALIDFMRFQQQEAVFKMDIGTNAFYQFKIGNEKGRIAGVDTITNATSTTRWKQRNNSRNSFFNTAEEIALPARLFDSRNRYIQLISSKDERGKSSAVSKVISVPVGFQNVRTDLLDMNASIPVMPEPQFNANRRLSHSQSFLAQELSLEDILSSLLRNALPAAIGMMGGSGGNAGSSAPATAAAPNNTALNAVSSLLNLLLRSVTGGVPSLSGQQSFASSNGSHNRFANPHSQFSSPFIFGIDDALLATLAGPLIQQGVQLLPQLINAANQHRLDTLRANNQLMTTLNADVQRRLMMQQLLQNMPTPASGGAAMDSAQLMQLLQQLQSAAASQPPAPQRHHATHCYNRQLTNNGQSFFGIAQQQRIAEF